MPGCPIDRVALPQHSPRAGLTTLPAAETVAVVSTETAAAGSTAGSAAASEMNAADVEFAQGMIAHHEQAIEMAEIAIDPNVGQVLRSSTSPHGSKAPRSEVEVMTGWLTAAGEPVAMDTSRVMRCPRWTG